MAGDSSVARMSGLVVLLLLSVCSVSSAPEPLSTAGVVGGKPAAGSSKAEWVGAKEDHPFLGGGPETGAIFGGKPNARDWPWIAMLLAPIKFVWKEPICGGSLINSRHVLTAAHCLENRTKEDLVVRLGEIDRRTYTDSPSSDYTVSQIIMHPSYTKGSFSNDIALLRLSGEAKFSASVCTIPLPTGPTGDLAGRNVAVAGWGSTTAKMGTPNSKVLNELDTSLVGEKECKSFHVKEFDPASFPKFFPGGFLGNTKLCTKTKEGGKGECTGDSGGPLVERGPPRRLVGVLSGTTADKCGSTDPTIYTRVSAYLLWIGSNANMTNNTMQHCAE